MMQDHTERNYILAVRKQPQQAAEIIKIRQSIDAIEDAVGRDAEIEGAFFDIDNMNIIYHISNIDEIDKRQANIYVDGVNIRGVVLVLATPGRSLTDAEAERACYFLDRAAAERC